MSDTLIPFVFVTYQVIFAAAPHFFRVFQANEFFELGSKIIGQESVKNWIHARVDVSKGVTQNLLEK